MCWIVSSHNIGKFLLICITAPAPLSQSDEHKGKQIVHYVSSDLKKRSCAATLVGAYCIIYRGMTPEEACVHSIIAH